MENHKLEVKRIFLIASENEALVSACRSTIEKHISLSTIFTAADGAEALFKVDNVLPHVVILDARLAKFDGFDVTDRVLAMHREHIVSVILIAEIPSSERYVEEVITRQVQFLQDFKDEAALARRLSRALNRVSIDEGATTYRLRFLSPGEVLFKEGDTATSVFYVKKGELEVVRESEPTPITIGQVNKNEFVGEMAHFNGEARSATVRALTDCELIEIPSNTLDLVLFSKPAWAKALIATLSRRLKRTTDKVAGTES